MCNARGLLTQWLFRIKDLVAMCGRLSRWISGPNKPFQQPREIYLLLLNNERIFRVSKMKLKIKEK